MTEPLTLFIETIGPFGYQIHPHSFHLGTNERLARQIAEEMFNTEGVSRHADRYRSSKAQGQGSQLLRWHLDERA